jgi:hypothetical protein
VLMRMLMTWRGDRRCEWQWQREIREGNEGTRSKSVVLSLSVECVLYCVWFFVSIAATFLPVLSRTSFMGHNQQGELIYKLRFNNFPNRQSVDTDVTRSVVDSSTPNCSHVSL